MVRDIIMQEQLSELGITVTTDELFDLVQGKEPHQYIVQSFTNPQTKQLDRDRLSQFLRSFDQLQPDVKTQWVNLEKAIKDDRLNKKYNTLIGNSFYMPKVLLQRNYSDKARKASFEFFVLPYSDIKDTNVQVSDDEINLAYQEHKHEFEQPEPIRSIDYVLFEVKPSADDIKKATDDINSIKAELEKSSDKDIESLVNANSDAKYDSSFFAQGKLPARIDTLVFLSREEKDKTDAADKDKKPKKTEKKAKESDRKTAPSGLIIGPYIDNNTFYLAKLLDIQERPDSMKARHILLSYVGAQGAGQDIKLSKKDARKKADSLLEVLKKQPMLFEEFAKKFSNDPTAKEKGGDLGWFADGMMVYPFNEACLNGKVGDITQAETMFGFHIISITDKKEPKKKARVAVIKRSIDASSKTIQDIYARASRFQAENPNLQTFEQSAAKLGLNKRSAEYVKEMDNNITGLDQAREVVRWAFDSKTKVGDIKDFEVDNNYIIAALKGQIEKGIPKLETIRKQMIAIARKDKKADMLANKIIDAKKSASSIALLAAKFNVKIDTARDVTFSSFGLPGVGPEQNVIGKVFTLKSGVLSEPLKGEKGVFITYVENFLEPPAKAEFSSEFMQMYGMFRQRSGYEVYNALLKKADKIDNRMFYY
jgi:peptidyl-prolyl cis-trans isomerase D